MIVGLKRMYCKACEKYRWHETMFELARCVKCNEQQAATVEMAHTLAESEPMEIERF